MGPAREVEGRRERGRWINGLEFFLRPNVDRARENGALEIFLAPLNN